MGKHNNYNRPSMVEQTPTDVVEPVIEPVVAPVVESQVGMVDGCDKLRVRMLPSMTAGVIGMIDKGKTVVIDPMKSTDDFYSVCTEDGVVGFCVKTYIKVQ